MVPQTYLAYEVSFCLNKEKYWPKLPSCGVTGSSDLDLVARNIIQLHHFKLYYHSL